MQYFVVPKNALIFFPFISKESTHRIAQAASISFEYTIYTDNNFFYLD